MQVKIDSNTDKLAEVLRVIGSLYAVTLTTVDSEPKQRDAVTKSRRRSATRVAARRSPSTAEVRAWAVEHGHTVSSRGRIPAEVVSAFKASR